jgi:N-acylglucosamine-6-phosphate 2-epimerase
LTALDRLHRGLIVSCQAVADASLSQPDVLSLIAASVVHSGAVGIRTEGLESIRAIRQAVDVPIVGLLKRGRDGPYITPSLEDALAVAWAGADIVAIDATLRPRRDGKPLDEVIRTIHGETGRLVMADISTVEEGVVAATQGADLVATTLSGYTPYSAGSAEPDRELVRSLVARIETPVVAEGRIRTPRQARDAVEAGAFAVVVGAAITDPGAITAWFVEAIGTEVGTNGSERFSRRRAMSPDRAP